MENPSIFNTKVDLLLLVTILLVIVAVLLGVLESILDVGVVGVNAGEGSEKLLGMRDGGRAGGELRNERCVAQRDQTRRRTQLQTKPSSIISWLVEIFPPMNSPD